jgi:protein-L-isoaspartate(D-aspartate) O-methyltransferase
MGDQPDLNHVRRMFAEELRFSCGLTSARLIDALATVPRERFLPPGPWIVRGEGDPRAVVTPDDDPQHIYRNVSVAIDAERQLFNGAPGVVASWIEAAQRPDSSRSPQRFRRWARSERAWCSASNGRQTAATSASSDCRS